MKLFNFLALRRFIKSHPPAQGVRAASPELIHSYEGILPSSLLELWRKKGLGFYGETQLALIDPRPWQSVLDRWIVSARDDVRRTPVALTPFGVLIVHRRLSATDEDVVFLDPVSKETCHLAASLEGFFNQFFCDAQAVDTLIAPGNLSAAREECGPLAEGEVYEIDQTLLSMQVLKIARVDALSLHRRLRDTVDATGADVGGKPSTVGAALPAAHRAAFEGVVPGEGLAGLYLSTYYGWYRLLALSPHGDYRLLFWRIDDRSFERTEVRAYTGAFSVSPTADGDQAVELEIALRRDSLGSDARDEHLVAMRSGGEVFLLRASELEAVAESIGNRGELGSSEDYFRRVTLDEALEDEPAGGRAAPAVADMPAALRMLVDAEPLVMRITHVAEPRHEEEEEGEGTVMCTLDLDEKDGLRMNMPLFSPANTGRALKGWVWDLSSGACKAGVEYRRGADGAIEHGPLVGDVLTSRASR